MCRRLLLVVNAATLLADRTMPAGDTQEAATIEPAQRRCCPACGGQHLLYRDLLPSAATTPPSARAGPDST